ncbi:DUF58 domain-containing protein [Stieleria varia]|uniref:DUF58 domain-containing protein n=1 Tax=Stieleria varia TaxID=2528005 RepID=A0A5C6A4Q2_9BACT|nr:DUF58 domain-containing protein [Stieleria varia]TWT94416.1 hypothetical protein Pla52n_52370 [Stieleria varia]
MNSSDSTTATSRFLELRQLVALEHMRFVTPNRVEGPYSGRHRSRAMGGSGEFADYRPYTPGDDLRRLDWRVLGRTGRAYIKRFQEDTNLACLSVIDCSGSMRFDGQPVEPVAAGWLRRKASELISSKHAPDKLTYAQYFTTALTHLITRGGDQAGLALIGDGLHSYHAPGSTSTHAQGLYEAIEGITPSEESKLAAGLDEVIGRISGRGVLLLMSDFLVDDPRDLTASLRNLRHRGWEIVALHLIHPAEESLPEGVAFQFEGLEGESSVRCRVGEIRELYGRRWREHLERTRSIATAVGADYRAVSTATSYLDTLGQFLVQRAG